jgi:hypothetical protein
VALLLLYGDSVFMKPSLWRDKEICACEICACQQLKQLQHAKLAGVVIVRDGFRG